MDNKRRFLEKEIWSLTFSAAFQRAKVYAKNVTEEEKKDWRKDFTKRFIEDILPKYQEFEVNADHHILNIEEVKRLSKSKIFNGGQLNFGVAQKILNLYLKYLWCLGELKFTPPHFPVDRRIQEILNLRPIVAWTTIEYSLDYQRIIDKAEQRLYKDYKGVYANLAEMELHLFTRSADEENGKKQFASTNN